MEENVHYREVILYDQEYCNSSDSFVILYSISISPVIGSVTVTAQGREFHGDMFTRGTC